MRIGFVLDDTLDSSDGVQQYVLLVGDWLTRQGHEVHYLVGNTNRSDIANIHSLARNIKVSFNKNRLSVPLPTSHKKITALFHEQKFDVLHIQMPFSPLLAGKIIKLAPKTTAIIGTFHVAPHGKNVSLGTRVLGKAQKHNLRRIDKVISVSEVAKQFAFQSQNLESTVIPNAIDLTAWRPRKTAGKKYDIAFVGRLVARKGCIYLLRGLVELKKLEPELRPQVIIVGDGHQRAMLESFVHDNGLDDICKFAGYATEEEKKLVLQSSRLAVFPATGGESFGIVLIEAMAAGATVLAGDNPGYTTVLGAQSNVLFSPVDSKQLAHKVHTMLTNEKMLKEIHDDQQKLVRQYDINIVGNAILKIYKETIKSKSHARTQ